MGKYMKIGALILGAITLTLGSVTSALAGEKAEKMTLSKTSIKVTEGKSITIKTSGKASVRVKFSSDVSNKKFSLSTDGKAVVRVTKISDYYYKVKGLKSGKVKLTVKSVEDPSLSKDLTVTVKKKGKKAVKKGAGIRKLTSENFVEEIEKKKGRAAIMFGTTWCGYCKLLDPIYKEVAEKDGNVRYYHVDGDEERFGLVELFGVGGFPSIYLIENKRTIDLGGYIRNWKVADYIKWANEEKK